MLRAPLCARAFNCTASPAHPLAFQIPAHDRDRIRTDTRRTQRMAMRICIVKLSALALAVALLLPRVGSAQLTDADLKRMRADRRVALVIGNGNYRNFQRLDNPVKDATGVAAALRA